MNWRTLWLRVQSLGFWVFLAIVAAGAALLFVSLWQKQGDLQTRINRLNAELSQLETQEKQLRTDIEALKTDPVYLERVAREKLNLVTSNETVFQFPATHAVTNPPRRP